tara:strand:- start:3980 stop:4528 length:549 start_codon:yes stop_codon:yes gene_type:complete
MTNLTKCTRCGEPSWQDELLYPYKIFETSDAIYMMHRTCHKQMKNQVESYKELFGSKIRLFVDCDDTLVIYETSEEKNPYGFYLGESWHPNEPLIEGIKKFQENNPNAAIIIWSGGGRKYAEEWTKRLFEKILTPLNFNNIINLTKDRDAFGLIRPGDVVIDDEDLADRRTHYPHEWPTKSV